MDLNAVASCAESVKLWSLDVDGGAKLKTECSTHSGTVNAVAWNHTAKVLASVGDDGRAALTLPNGQLLCTLPQSDMPREAKEELYSVAFGGNSRYLVTGGTMCLVKIWDLKAQTLLKSLSGHTSPITAVTFNRENNTVASASKTGDVLLYNLLTTTPKPSVPLKGIDGQSINAIQYSPFNKTQLAGVSDGGSVYLWDTSRMALAASFDSAHSGPATSVSYSPYNHLLMCSVGLDGFIKFYDIEEHKIIKQIDTEEKLTSLSFMNDGVTVAVGTATGSVLVYDLRAGDAPTHCIRSAHAGSVRGISFQQKPSSKKRSSSSSSRSSSSSSSHASSTTHSRRKRETTLKSAVLNAAAVAAAETAQEVTNPDSQLPEIPSSTSTPIHSKSPQDKYEGQSRGGPTIPYPDFTEEAIEDKKKSPELDGGAFISTVQQPQSAPIQRSLPPQVYNPVFAQREAEFASAFSPAQSEVIKSFIGDTLSVFRNEMHRDIHNMHVDLIRQFQIQKNEMEAMLASTSVNGELCKEIERLRKENQLLRQHF